MPWTNGCIFYVLFSLKVPCDFLMKFLHRYFFLNPPPLSDACCTCSPHRRRCLRDLLLRCTVPLLSLTTSRHTGSCGVQPPSHHSMTVVTLSALPKTSTPRMRTFGEVYVRNSGYLLYSHYCVFFSFSRFSLSDSYYLHTLTLRWIRFPCIDMPSITARRAWHRSILRLGNRHG